MRSFVVSVAIAVAAAAGAVASGDEFGSGENAFSIEFVSIGSPGNEPAGSRGGDVDYYYRIAKYETSRELIEKANAEGNLGITMLDPVPAPRDQMPATGISWLEAARFVNWLNETSGYPHAYNFTTQPGDIDYVTEEDLLLWDAADEGFDPGNLFRNSLSQYFLPSRDEWHKAAYFDERTATYFQYPTTNGNDLTLVAMGTFDNAIVFGSQLEPADVNLAGGPNLAGVTGLAGNAEELLETAFDLTNDDPLEGRTFRRGSWASHEQEIDLLRTNAAGIIGVRTTPQAAAVKIGFRVASVPEPSASVQAFMAFASMLACRMSKIINRSNARCCLESPNEVEFGEKSEWHLGSTIRIVSLPKKWTTDMRSFVVSVAIAVAAAAGAVASGDEFGSGENAFSIEFVSIGSPGNETNSFFGGAVDYHFRIAKYETSRELIEKANAEGNLGISMLDPVPAPRDQMPATGISWLEAARFVNWLNETSGYPHAYNFTTQPGDIDYVTEEDLLLWDAADEGFDPGNLFRNSLSQYFLPSRDEWHKAAYFDERTATYFQYPTTNGNDLTLVAMGTFDNAIVFGSQLEPADVNLAGGPNLAGVTGLAGNAEELLETAFDLTNDDPLEGRTFRRGSWASHEQEIDLLRTNAAGIIGVRTTSQAAAVKIGFRVASVPEPSASVQAFMAFASMLACRCRRSSTDRMHGAA